MAAPHLRVVRPTEDERPMEPPPHRIEHWKEILGATLVGVGILCRMVAQWVMDRSRVREEHERARLADALAKAEAAQAEVRRILEAGVATLEEKVGRLESRITELLDERAAMIHERASLTERVRVLEDEGARVRAACDGCPLRAG